MLNLRVFLKINLISTGFAFIPQASVWIPIESILVIKKCFVHQRNTFTEMRHGPYRILHIVLHLGYQSEKSVLH